MFKILFALLLLFTIQGTAQAQDKHTDAQAIAIPEANSTSVDALTNYIRQNFTSDSDHVRAIYVWIAHHISYDVLRLQAVQKNPARPPQPVADVLKTRSAVCQGYADLFVALCKGVGIDAMVVGGYTKTGSKVNGIPHAWVATALSGQWYLFDPTWGAGYVTGGTFVKAFNNSFYKVQPATFIADHMPFDPMYQFLSYPLTHKEFIAGTPAATNVLFHYSDSLKQNSQLSSVQQMAAELRRLEDAGVQNDVLLKRELFLKNALEAYTSKDVFDEGGKAFAAAIDLYNEYIKHKNNQFSTISDNDLRQMADSMVYFIKLSRSLLMEAVPKDDAQRQAKAGNIANIERFWAQLNKENDFLQQYFAADVAQRKQLFTRR